MSLADYMGLALFFLAVIWLIAWTTSLPHHVFRQPTSIHFRFTPRGVGRSLWRRMRRMMMDPNIGVGVTEPGTLMIVDQNGGDLTDAQFDESPTLNTSDPTIVTIAAGATFKDIEVTGVAAGSATITADGVSGGVTLQQGVATATVTQLNNAFGIDIRFAQ